MKHFTIQPIFRYFSLAFIGLLLLQCANFQPYRSDKVTKNETPPASGNTDYSTFFVGDLGYDHARGLVTLDAISKAIRQTENKKSLLLLGDIVGPEGLKRKDASEKEKLDAIIALLEQTPGKIFYTPGESELGGNGYFSRLNRLEKYFDKHSDKKVKFMPNKGCSGPDDDEIYAGVGLIGASTAWYLANWNNESEVSEGCDFNDRHDFLFALADEIKGYRDKVKIVMMHHPLASEGNRGGHFSLSQHLFPLADVIPGAYLPLPGLGSIIRGLQSVSGGSQDLNSLRYRDLIVQLKARTEDENNVIFIGGHEHNMLYKDGGYYHVLTAGSGSVKGPAKSGGDADFSYGTIGYGRLDFQADGSVYLSFQEVNDNGQTKEVFTRRIIENRFEAAKPDLDPVIPEPVVEKTIKTPVYSANTERKSGLYRSVWGKHYRTLYGQEVEIPVLYIDTLFGGLTPYRRGGGQTTQSLHTQGADGHLYQLRSIRKNPAQLLPNLLERTFAADLARDQFTALHPYAPLTLPRMQKELGLLGASPKIYFIPKQPALGDFNSSFGGEMYYLEQRADEDWSGTGFYANSKNIISNSDMREEMRKDWKHRADQQNYLVARLFDFLIGDWDRHRDQWRWAEIDQPDGFKTYLPVARDRDQVYSNFDGALLSVIGIILPDARKLNSFEGKLDKAKWRALNGKWNDRFFLNEMEKEDFKVAAQFIVSQLTDEVIDEAMQAFPPEVMSYSLEQEDIDGKLKSRRAQLVDFAMDYYKVLAEVVTVTATDKDDVLTAESTPEGNLHVRIYDADKDGKADELYYDRTFVKGETREVRLYGMDGDDRFELKGSQSSPIRIRLIGGTDKDEVSTDGKLTARIYDNKNGMTIDGKRNNLKDRRSDRYPELNQYQFQEYKPDYTVPFPSFGFNVDDGLYFGMGVTVRRHGFRPDPYAVNHYLFSSASTNGTIQADYVGEFNNTFGQRKDLVAELSYRSPDYVVNFFGLGNESADRDLDNLEFNRTRQQRLHFSPLFRLRGKTNRKVLTVGPFYETFKVDRGEAIEEATLISQPGVVPERVFNGQAFAGLRMDFSMNNLALPNIPDTGFKLKAKAERTYNLDSDRNFFNYGGEFTYYQFFGKQVIGLASRIGFEHIDGEAEFYQLVQLGGRTNFRAVRSERFLGNTVFYHNTDLRIKGFGFSKNASAVTGGFLLGFDYGRVWLDGEESDIWHYAYGGGLWYAPFNAVVLSATYFDSKDGGRINVGVGFPF